MVDSRVQQRQTGREAERTLWLSSRISYARNLGARICEFERKHLPHEARPLHFESRQDGLEFADYRQYANTTEGNQRLRSHPRIICSLESLLRLLDGNTLSSFKRIVLDEVQELL